MIAVPIAKRKKGGTMLQMRALLPLAAIAAVLTCPLASSAETIIDEWSSVKAPPPPELKSVTLDPKTTAILVIDLIKQTCNEQRRPRCVASIPKVAKLLAEARAHGAAVIYSLFPSPNPANIPNPVIGDYVPAVAPKGDEPVVTAFVDKFAIGDKDTGLQKILKDKGITTLVPVGTTPHNGVLFTSVAAAFRGFTRWYPSTACRATTLTKIRRRPTPSETRLSTRLRLPVST
jgi:nicotinamidase-related amidase